MRGCGADVRRSHPRLGAAAIQGVAVHRHVGREDEPVSVVGGDGHLALSEGHGACTGYHVHLLAIGDGLQALDSPDGKPFVGVDAAGDVGECESCHWLRR